MDRCVHFMFRVRFHGINETFYGKQELTLGSVMAQVFVVVGASNVIAFIIRDLGEPALVGWIIQVRLLPLLSTGTVSNI